LFGKSVFQESLLASVSKFQSSQTLDLFTI